MINRFEVTELFHQIFYLDNRCFCIHTPISLESWWTQYVMELLEDDIRCVYAFDTSFLNKCNSVALACFVHERS